jgi:hypothetical protein
MFSRHRLEVQFRTICAPSKLNFFLIIIAEAKIGKKERMVMYMLVMENLLQFPSSFFIQLPFYQVPEFCQYRK